MSTASSTRAAAGFSRSGLLWLATVASAAGCTSVNPTQATFDGTRWYVMAVNQQAVQGDRIAFSGDSFEGTVGCNFVGGHYRVSDGWLVPAQLRMTERGCVDPQVMDRERQAFAILSRPMRISWESGRRLTLGNEAGSMTLELSGAD